MRVYFFITAQWQQEKAVQFSFSFKQEEKKLWRLRDFFQLIIIFTEKKWS